MKKYQFLGGLLLAIFAAIFGASSGVCMAETVATNPPFGSTPPTATMSPNPQAGIQVQNSPGGMTITSGIPSVRRSLSSPLSIPTR